MRTMTLKSKGTARAEDTRLRRQIFAAAGQETPANVSPAPSNPVVTATHSGEALPAVVAGTFIVAVTEGNLGGLP